MSKNAPISAMLTFHFGAKSFCTNGQDGVVTHVLLDATSRRLTYLALKQGRFFGKTVYVPFEMVRQASGDGVWLTCTLADLAAAASPDRKSVV